MSINQELELQLRKANRNQAQSLNLSNQKIEEIPIQLYELKKLLVLDLSFNLIVFLDKKIENLIHLKSLDLSHNKILTLPIELSNLQFLESLSLKDNPIYNLIGGDFSVKWREELKDYVLYNKKLSSSKNLNENINSISNNYNKIINDNNEELISQMKVELNNNYNIKDPNVRKERPETTNNPVRAKLLEKIQAEKGGISIKLKDGSSNNFNKQDLKKMLNKNFANKTKTNKQENNEINSINNDNKIITNYNIKQSQNIKILEDEFNNYESFEPKTNMANDYKTQSNNSNSNNFNQNESKEFKFFKKNTQEPIKSKSELFEENKLLNEQVTELKKLLEINETNHMKDISELKKNLEELEEINLSLQSVKFNNNNNSTKEKVPEFLSKNNNNEISMPNKTKQRGNWMEETKTAVNNINSQVKNDIIKEEESLLQKEQLNNKRLKAEVTRLTEKLNSMNSNSVFNNKNSNVLDINMNDIEIKEKIGEGGFATINKGKWLFLDVAVKIIFDPKVTQELLDEFNNEIKMLAVFKHPNIVSLLATCSKPKLAIVMEHVSRGSLYNVLHKER
jgi:hypothetical protein